MSGASSKSQRPLTPRQKQFVEEYLVDLNGTQAAIRAGYSAKTAGWIAQELLTKTHISEAIAAATKARSERTKISADWVLTRLVEEADADLVDLYQADGSLKPVQEWPVIWRKGLVAGLDIEEIRAGDGSVIGVTKKVRLSDRLKRLELLGKHLKLFTDKLDLGGQADNPLRLLLESLSGRSLGVAQPQNESD
ncbi:MAG: terminase small subunit [Chromatiales bacterium]|nr:terminase small subunit [Chromatiales bacterium]